jgi:hypothetical protein
VKLAHSVLLHVLKHGRSFAAASHPICGIDEVREDIGGIFPTIRRCDGKRVAVNTSRMLITRQRDAAGSASPGPAASERRFSNVSG